ncbi:MAG: hypothetical protein ABIU77_20095 [Ferruginibacter sp.]|jgi:hypothetical protein
MLSRVNTSIYLPAGLLVSLQEARELRSVPPISPVARVATEDLRKFLLESSLLPESSPLHEQLFPQDIYYDFEV